MRAVWVYDLRTNKHFTLKKNPLRRDDLDDFVSSYASGRPLSERIESERWRSFAYDELVARDKVNLDITWLRDESLEDADNLPSPEVIAREIVEDLIAALVEFEGRGTGVGGLGLIRARSARGCKDLLGWRDPDSNGDTTIFSDSEWRPQLKRTPRSEQPEPRRVRRRSPPSHACRRRRAGARGQSGSSRARP
jgi:hypothetical protein